MLGNTLSAAELLKNKGIRFKALEKWDKTSETLPSKGQKQYQPNNTWLQRRQIEQGLKNRKDLLSIERVERSSQLAAAEWLSQESRAHVTKKSGQEWANFGYEENSELYLLPEEALLLIELNCLELTWKGLALSVQQAYCALLESDESECSLEEYRVYSHLVRQGYRLQRFRYQGNTAWSERTSSKRKRRALDSEVSDRVAKTTELKIVDDLNHRAAKEPRLNGETAVKKDLKRLPSEVYDNGVVNLPGPSNADDGESKRKPGRVAKVQIISDETVLGELEILSRLSGSRIRKRNVKEILGNKECRDTEESFSTEMEICDDKGEKKSQAATAAAASVGPEVIDISDEEIEVLPRKLSRMDLLNLIPNVMSESYTFKPISKRYLPDNVRPQTSAAKLSCWKTRWRDDERGDTSPRFQSKNNAQQGLETARINDHRGMLPPGRCQLPWLPMSIFQRASSGSLSSVPRSGGFWKERSQVGRKVFGRTQPTNNQQRSILSDPSCFTWRQNSSRRSFPRWLGERSFRSDPVEVWKPSFKIVPGAASWSETKERWLRDKTIEIEDEDPGDPMDVVEETEEIEVVMQPLKPLVGPKNAKSLSEVYKRLQIIKEAPSLVVRRSKKGKDIDYRISYNLYSMGQPYRKTNPGRPLYRIVVFSLDDTPFIELADITQLQQDSKDTPIVLACVSRTSITFAELGKVSIPEIHATT